MEKFFEAVGNRHPGCQIVDVRFMIDVSNESKPTASDVGSALADVVENATELDRSAA